MTPHSLAFYMDVITSGTVLGAKPTDTPDQVAKLLGPDFGENSFDVHNMWRDYGMTEFFWSRESAEHPWAGHHFTLQVHRLAYGRSDVVEKTLRTRYGRFERRLRFEKLQRLLAKRGTPLVEVPSDQSPHYRWFWQPESLAAVSVIGAHDEYLTPGNLRVGDVNSITAPMTVEEVEWRKLRLRQQHG
ncbi:MULTISPECIES: hypothetical protein [Streptomyces]|uniref:Uncharacterized protein n=1 Tax=Streptomyces griseocarneus TaxID=51201 RepID=A0ABX7RJS3_9ACTN|nr:MULTISPECIES: hypothetical protein [Streptomyces]QSY47598.1 hypothetical protein J3S04_20145 [Streptomyces griseocarneus]